MVSIMSLKDFFKNDELVLNYIEGNRISDDEEITFLDIMRIIKNSPNRIDLLLKYNEYKKSNSQTKKIIDYEFDELFETEKTERIKNYPGKSVWNSLSELSDDGYTHKKILRAFINLNEQNSSFQKYKDIISLYPIEKNNLFNTIFFDFLGKIKFETRLELKFFLSYINQNNYDLYINPWIDRKYNNYLHKKNIIKISDLKLYLNENNFSKEYNELVNLLLLFEETNKLRRPCDYQIDSYLNENINPEKLIILNMIIRDVNKNYILKYGKLSYKNYKKICTDYNRILVKYFDKFQGRYAIKYLLSLNDGYFTLSDLKTIYPKTYKYIIYAQKNKLIYGLKYYENYEIYSLIEINSDEDILNKYKKYLCNEEYIALKNDIYTLFLNKGIIITNEIIDKRLEKIYKKVDNFYAKGYISTEYKIFNLCSPFIKTGIKNIDLFLDDYQKRYCESINKLQLIYTFFTKINDTYYLKMKYINKYTTKEVSDMIYKKNNKEYNEYLMVFSVCESYKSIFTVESISKETDVDKKIIKEMLKKSLYYYQLKNNTFIKCDALRINNEIITFFKSIHKETKRTKYLKTKERYNVFLKYYKIKNEKYLSSLINKLLKNENKKK